MSNVAIQKSDSLATELNAVRQAFPDALFDVEGKGWQRLLDRAASVPASLIENVFGFELRLGPIEGGADFCITVGAGSQTALELLSVRACDAKVTESEATTRGALLDLLTEIDRDRSFANDAVRSRSVILEYDVVKPQVGRNSAPGVFWGLEEQIGPAEMSGIVQLLDIAQTGSGRPTSGDDQAANHRIATLRRIAQAAAPYGRISQVGTFLGRDRLDFRILVRVEQRECVSELLHALDWCGDVGKVTEVASHFAFENIGFGLSLDVGAERVGPRLGLEVGYREGWFGTRFADWRRLIEVLVAHGWCRENKARGLQQWCGYIPLFGREMYFLLKGINHFKISIQNDEFLGAKAYVGAGLAPAQTIGFA